MIKEVPMSRNDVFIDLGSGKSCLELICMVTLWSWRQSGPVVYELDSESSGPCSNSGQSDGVVFLGKILHTRSAHGSPPRCILNGYQRI